ncbi:type I 3-dehydroquinate dehydratase [Waddlia chondrophila]|uniref:Shikimate dehydrogenase (NADP(+)) n=1 Tax=Waddlia chondrophila (strain ATCC VR-1470 / WSU 86-1044) TaxID=716544 RepID=D6YWZ6_WADCW|nr:type I 3-dehydroquinate dehydratase [Waddlia chondrophila]ADI38657.1 bifunctional 3-dehydroquinate dehydratase/shikimate dehydrogenase [Waddlia chondrophila WSU 86-1044]
MNVCVPITARTLPEALKEISFACSIAEMIELRLDYLDHPSPEGINELVQACEKPVIATYRKKNPVPLLKAALDAGADYVDVEEINTSLPLERCIYSIHLQETPPLEELYQSMKASGAAIIKIVPTARSFIDNIAILNLLKKYPEDRLIAFCMGEKGLLSRYFAPAYGSFCTFGAIAEGKKSAPGQPLATHLRKWKAQVNTTLCGVIGDPITHSLSPAIHQAAYEADGLNFLFLPFHTTKEDLPKILDLMRQFPLRGLAVTVPHKESVIPMLDEVDVEAQAIGAVNTIINHGGKLTGYNTDVFGAVQPLQKRTDLRGKRVAILGNGGAAKAFAYGLQKEGSVVTLFGRNLEKLKEQLMESEILIQTTPVGMAPNTDKTLVPPDFLHQNLLVFDCVYNPLKTQLLKDAEKAGCRTISGLEMFMIQAREQYKFFTSQEANEEAMKKAALNAFPSSKTKF